MLFCFCFFYKSNYQFKCLKFLANKLLLLQDSLAVVYATCCPSQYTIYEPVIRLKGQVKTVPSQRPFSSKEVQSNVLDSHHLKALQPVEYKNLQGILHEIGGTGAFVFLFARVREMEDGDSTCGFLYKIVLSSQAANLVFQLPNASYLKVCM